MLKNTQVSLKSPRKRKNAIAPVVNDPRALRIPADPSKSEDRQMADFGLSAVGKNAITAAFYGSHTLPQPLALTESVEATQEKVRAVRSGCMDEPEALLVAQSQTLDAIFNSLAQRALTNIHSGYTDAAEKYLRLALKAQSQCRTTVEALGELKQPRTPTFIRQANIANQQQVNNGDVRGEKLRSASSPSAAAHEKILLSTNELLTETPHAKLDNGRASAPVCADSNLEAMGTIHGAAH